MNRVLTLGQDDPGFWNRCGVVPITRDWRDMWRANQWAPWYIEEQFQMRIPIIDYTRLPSGAPKLA